ncbi:MAG: hypothetical protein CL933_23465 [Deltaproteobacteria bacterium]|nr:hypothetical protein [Deltaproteobacteria bacterium]
MMKRFSRKRRGQGGGGQSVIDASEWLPRLAEQGIVESTSLEVWPDAGVPGRVAAIGRGERADGSRLLVAFSPNSATEAMLGGLAAAQRAAAESDFAGELLVVAPQWPAGARRVLGLLGRTPYSIEPVAAPGLIEGRVVVEPELSPRILATSVSQLASRMLSPEARSAFSRAATALEGLAAKHGGCVRVGVDRLELVVLARRVAEIRADGESAVLEIQIGGRSTTPLSGADLAGALDGLEGQLRRRLNDRKVREGEEGLRGRVIGQLASGSELRGLRAWPQPGVDLDAVDGVGVNAAGDPVVVAVREEFEWRSLAAVLESLAPVGALLPVLLADTAPPLRLGMPRLLLTAERFVDGLEKALSALVVAYELRAVSGEAGAGVDLVSRSAGEGAESRPTRRGRRRGGRGRSAGGPASEARPDVADGESAASEDAEGLAVVERGKEEGEPARPMGPRSEARGEDGEGERGRGRRRRRSRRGGRGAGGDVEADAPSREGRDGQDGSGGEGTRGPRRFEEVSLMDLDDGLGASEEEESVGGGERRRRPRRRSRRGGSDGRKGGANGSGSDSKPEVKDGAGSEEEAGEALSEDDLVDADDLSEILARLADDAPEFDGPEGGEISYDDEEEVEDEGDSSVARANRDSRNRARGGEVEDEGRSQPRKRSAILVHADPDSLLAAILLARDIRQLDGMWVYPQEELMTFFRSIATDLRDDMPIFVVGFSPSPAHDVIQASALYRGRLTWFDRQAWPPEDLAALRQSLGADAIAGGEGLDSTLPLVLETCGRRSRFSDKLVDLATGRFTQHDFERWGRLWRWRIAAIANKSGDIRGDVAALLTGRPSDLAKEAALVELPPAPPEVGWVAERDFRLVHFGGHVLVVLEADPECDVHLASRVARERYGATLSLARNAGEEVFVFAGDETTGKRSLDYMAMADHLVQKLEWVESRPDADHVSRFFVRDLERHPERLEELIGEIAMGRSLLER